MGWLERRNRFGYGGPSMAGPTLLLTVLLAGPLFQPGPAETERFKAYFTRGEQLYQQGEYGAAIWNFRQADAIRVTPEVAYDLAKCHEKLGDQAFATLYYRLYLRRAPNASDALDVAERVGTSLAQAEAEGRGFLEVDAPGAKSLVLDGRRYPEGPIAVMLPPGDVELKGVFGAGEKRMVAQLRTGKATHVLFEPLPPPLLQADGSPVEATDVAAADLVASSSGRSNSKLRTGAYAVAGIGVAALVTAAILGGLSGGDAARATTDKSLTTREADGLAGAANGKAWGANVLFGVGGAALAGGVVMFVFSMPEPGMPSGGASR